MCLLQIKPSLGRVYVASSSLPPLHSLLSPWWTYNVCLLPIFIRPSLLLPNPPFHLSSCSKPSTAAPLPTRNNKRQAWHSCGPLPETVRHNSQFLPSCPVSPITSRTIPCPLSQGPKLWVLTSFFPNISHSLGSPQLLHFSEGEKKIKITHCLRTFDFSRTSCMALRYKVNTNKILLIAQYQTVLTQNSKRPFKWLVQSYESHNDRFQRWK